jgi:N-acetylmuramoyl-L-alanine amidase
VAKRSRIRNDCQITGIFAKAITGNADVITARGYGVELKFPVIIAQRFAFPIGTFGLQLEMSAGDGAMLRIVYDAAHGAENAGECGTNKTGYYEKPKDVIAKAEKSLHGEGVFSN